jgi:hypothetical protein
MFIIPDVILLSLIYVRPTFFVILSHKQIFSLNNIYLVLHLWSPVTEVCGLSGVLYLYLFADLLVETNDS